MKNFGEIKLYNFIEENDMTSRTINRQRSIFIKNQKIV